MVTLAPPSLTPREAEILDAYFTARGDLAAVAQRLNLSAADLLVWRAAPAVAAALEALDVLNDQAQRFRLSCERHAAIDALARVCRESESLVEQRLAATALLRGPSAPRAPRVRRAAPPEDLNHSDRSAPPRAYRPSASSARRKHQPPVAPRSVESTGAPPASPAPPPAIPAILPSPMPASSLLGALLPTSGMPAPRRSPADLVSRAGRADTS